MSRPRLNRSIKTPNYAFPPRALQVGEGNFIRGFVDWMIHCCNEQGLFQGSVIITQPRDKGAAKLRALREQEGLFTLLIRGLENGQSVQQTEVVSSISQAIDPFSEWAQFLALAENPAIEFMFSNTTESGLTYTKESYSPADSVTPVHSFPGKLTAFLYRRFQTFGTGKGMILFPCELIERNGDRLKEIVLHHAKDWGLGAEFQQYLIENNRFVNSLVDRIVTGYPSDAEAIQQQQGYEDQFLTASEPYHLWVIEGDQALADKLPFQQAGLNVRWTDDLTPFATRKVRLLNGAHTFMVPMSYLNGHNIVRGAIEDAALSTKVKEFLEDIAAIVLPFSQEESRLYIEDTLERFRNPFIDHKLLDIALNTTSKFRTRIYPTLVEYLEQKQELPAVVLESFAYLIRFYRCQKAGNEWIGSRTMNGHREDFTLHDSEQALTKFAALWAEYEHTQNVSLLVDQVLGSAEIWGEPALGTGFGVFRTRLVDQLAAELQAILAKELGD
ncbi:MAG: altronate oxidoreductase [Bacilli bacterium]|nr:altronate oxidoreductase [Bacilli bacterium]